MIMRIADLLLLFGTWDQVAGWDATPSDIRVNENDVSASVGRIWTFASSEQSVVRYKLVGTDSEKEPGLILFI